MAVHVINTHTRKKKNPQHIVSHKTDAVLTSFPLSSCHQVIGHHFELFGLLLISKVEANLTHLFWSKIKFASNILYKIIQEKKCCTSRRIHQ